ncbi:E3 ubiquitin-protein ligase Siah1-like isoform X2 [Cimex lectularius]|uniref:RING-type E3 ubiquitin transferase n=1 Tax=Cimex lectularius TaxID=79782 RepID=A0A8I6S2V7_CIMLE|nr:E3 ubiquitin-protein ligase Siah1-like isoform X2 [Cimex lectularius]
MMAHKSTVCTICTKDNRSRNGSTSGASENGVQRPERPTRAIPNTFSPRSLIVHAPGVQSREELPRPNAPAPQEEIDNRPINNHNQNGFVYLYRAPNLVDTVTTPSTTGPITSPRLSAEFQMQQADIPREEANDLPQDLRCLSGSGHLDMGFGARDTGVGRMQHDRIVPRPAPYPESRVTESEAGNSSNSVQRSTLQESELLKAVLAALECPVCRDYVTPPIRLCLLGHMLCSNCRSRLVLCPECRGPLSNIRARGLESIAAVLNYPCSNQGCQAVVPLTMQPQHAIMCGFRRLSCFFTEESECLWQGLKNDLVSHCLASHPNSVTLEPSLIFNLELGTDNRKDFIMNCFDQLFHVVFMVEVSTRFVFGTVRRLGELEKLKDFLWTMTCESPGAESPKAKLTFSNFPETESTPHYKFNLAITTLFRFCFTTLNEFLVDNALTINVTVSRTGGEQVSTQCLSGSQPHREQPQVMESWGDRVSPSR